MRLETVRVDQVHVSRQECLFVRVYRADQVLAGAEVIGEMLGPAQYARVIPVTENLEFYS